MEDTVDTTTTDVSAAETSAESTSLESTSADESTGGDNSGDDWVSLLTKAEADVAARGDEDSDDSTDESTDETANTEVTAAETKEEEEQFDSEAEKSNWEKRVDRLREREKAKLDEEYFGANGAFSWAKDVPKEDGVVAVSLLTDLRADPIKSMTELIKGMAENQEAVPVLQKWALDLLGLDESVMTGEPAKAPAAKTVGKKGSIKTDTGVSTYTDEEINALIESAVGENAVQAARAEIEKELGPAKKERAQKEHVQRENQKFSTKWQSAHDELAKLPGFEDNKAAIGKTLVDMIDKGQLNPDNVAEVSYRVYLQVVGPKLKDAARSEYVKSVKHKATAGTISPFTSATQQPFNPQTADFSTLLEHFDKKLSAKK